MLLNMLKILVVFVPVTLYGCVAVPVIYAVGAADREEKAVQAEATLKPFVEFVSVETDKGVTTSMLRGAKVFTAVLEDDMKTVKSAPSLREKEFGNVVMEETLRAFSVTSATINTLDPVTLRIEVLYGEGREPSRDRYLSFFQGGIWFGYKTSKGRITEEQGNRWYGLRKGTDLRLTLRRGDDVLMKARGFWGGNDKADEIAGARQLAREMTNAVLKKLNSPASQRTPVAEAKKD